jgi:hypothetical protein
MSAKEIVIVGQSEEHSVKRKQASGEQRIRGHTRHAGRRCGVLSGSEATSAGRAT